MTTFRKWFESFTEQTGDTVETVMIAWDEYAWNKDSWPALPPNVVDLDEIDAAILDFEFDEGFGGSESPNLCAWSKHYVLFSDVYDGAESLQWVPKRPKKHTPIRPGG